MRVGYYVHHHGRGHATRAGVIGAELERRGHAVTYLGSGALPDGDRVVLVRDDDDADAPFVDADAKGLLHWAPLGGGYATRSSQIASWVAEARPDVVVVDVSVEVTVLVRLLGVPVVVIGQPGCRDDAPHDLVFDLATAVLAPWPAGLDVAPHLAGRPTVVEVGGLTRFEGRGHRDNPSSRGDAVVGGDSTSRHGVLLVGGEGWDDPGLPDAIRDAMPEVQWRSPDADHPVDVLLAETQVVVTHAGQNAIADVAAFGVPAVVVPQERPFDEQADMARALESAGIARGLALGASVDEIGGAVRALLAGDDDRSTGAAWARWNINGAAERAAAVIERAAGVTASVGQEGRGHG